MVGILIFFRKFLFRTKDYLTYKMALQNAFNSIKSKALGVAEYMTPILKVSYHYLNAILMLELFSFCW